MRKYATDLKKGDFVAYIYAQPGNEREDLVVLHDYPMSEANPDRQLDKVKCYAAWFDREIELCRDWIFHLSDGQLDSTMHHFKFGMLTIRERLEQIKAAMCAPPEGM